MTITAGTITAVSYEPAHLDWAPLEGLARVGLVRLCDWMWMSVARTEDGRSIHAYKHCDTRNYLHVDDAGHTVNFPTCVPHRQPTIPPTTFD